MIVETIFKQIIIDIENLNPELVNKIKNYLKRHDVQYQIKFTKKRESLIHFFYMLSLNIRDEIKNYNSVYRKTILNMKELDINFMFREGLLISELKKKQNL